MGLEAVHQGDALALDQIQAGGRLEGGRDDLFGAGEHGRQGALGIAEGVKQRQVIENDVARRHGQAIGPFLNVTHQVVGMHDTLGKAGGPRGVHDERRGVAVHRVGALAQLFVRNGGAGLQGGVPCGGAGVHVIANNYHALQSGIIGVRHLRSLGRQPDNLPHHVEVIHGARDVMGDQHHAIGLMQHVG